MVNVLIAYVDNVAKYLTIQTLHNLIPSICISCTIQNDYKEAAYLAMHLMTMQIQELKEYSRNYLPSAIFPDT